MATLNALKQSLRQKANPSFSRQPLSDIQYSAGFDILVSGGTTYQDFIIPQLSQLLSPLFNSRNYISVLEIGPGPKSVLGYLPDGLRQKIRRYVAYEPNGLFATRLEKWLKTEPLPCLDSPANIRRIPFTLESSTSDGDEKFDVVLFCHSMYGMKPKDSFISRALERLSEGGIVVVFHRDGTLHLNGLVCHQTASYPTGVVRMADDDETLDSFATFVAGFGVEEAIRVEWRQVCRALGHREEAHPHQLLFSAPDMMATFTRHATAVAELRALVPLGDKEVKNREARLHCPAENVRPTEVRHVQQTVRWALEHGVGLTVVGGGHSGHCVVSNVVSVDMGAFDQVHIITAGEEDSTSGSLIIAGAGCKTGDIIRKTMEAGLTVPLGSRPSVGAGSWLQGGIGHLARLHGLACDAIAGAVVVSVESGEILVIGHVPSQHIPAGAVRPDNESELLWAMRGAGTNFGIVVSITFKAYPAPTYLVRNWIVPVRDPLAAQLKLKLFDRAARMLPRYYSADAYLYWDADQLHLGVTMYESSTDLLALNTPTPTPLSALLGPENNVKVVDGIGLFDTEMYMSGMHGGHAGGKTSSFKRCLFLKDIRATNIINVLLAAIDTRPSPLCYLHLLQGGGAVNDMAPDATAFGNRDWDSACVITGVWPRDQDETEAARAAVRWVYNVAADMLPLSDGAYGADLGPDPRDAALAANAFGPNLPRLARLKQNSDPGNVLAYACPLPKPMEPPLIILVTGESCAGKDFCADVFVSVFAAYSHKARVTSISYVTKREYVADTGADLERLLCDRGYKEQHRLALTAFFQDQVRRRPRLPEEHFLSEVYGAVDVDVLIITGMRDEAPVAALSHLVPDSRLIEVRVEISEEMRRTGRYTKSNSTAADYRPNLTFTNDRRTGPEAARRFAEKNLIPFFDPDLRRLLSMIRPVPDFPRPGIEFRHVLDISQQPGGLKLVTSLLLSCFTGDWAEINRIACVEAGSFVFASALASEVDIPLALIRNAGKLPPPTVSVEKPRSHISSAGEKEKEERIEMGRDEVPRGAKVVVVDDVLATGKTLLAVLELLGKAGVGVEDISIMVVAEFPFHRGRELLRQAGFGRVNIQSLVIFGGA
jgi:adenine phosphoribosyltransferase